MILVLRDDFKHSVLSKQVAIAKYSSVNYIFKLVNNS